MNHLSTLPGQDGKRFQVAADRFSSLYVIVDTASGNEGDVFALNSAGYSAAYERCNALNYEDAEATGIEAEVFGAAPTAEALAEQAAYEEAVRELRDRIAFERELGDDGEVARLSERLAFFEGKLGDEGAAPVAVPAPTPVPVAPAAVPLTPDAATIEAALFHLEEEARRSRELCADAGDVEGEKIARRSERAYRDAAALLHAGEWHLTFRGDLLVRSGSGRGIWHRVGRVPAASDSWSPIVCSCEWSQKSDGLGPCKHQGFFEGIEQAQDAVIVEADARASFGLAA
jgi:hypothetical protein